MIDPILPKASNRRLYLNRGKQLVEHLQRFVSARAFPGSINSLLTVGTYRSLKARQMPMVASLMVSVIQILGVSGRIGETFRSQLDELIGNLGVATQS